MTKHTAGNWLFDEATNSLWMGPDDVVGIADLCPPCAEYYEAQANARLIAAAPGLLHACKVALEALKRDEWQEDSQTIDMLADTIARAEG